MITSKENCSIFVRAVLIFLMVGHAQSAPRPISSSTTSMQLSSNSNADSTTIPIPLRSTSQDANDNFDMNLPTRPDFQRMLSHRSHDALKNLLENSRTTQETSKVSQPTVAGTTTTTSSTMAEVEVVTSLGGSTESWTETGQQQQGSESYNDHFTEGATTKDSSTYDVGTTQYIGMPSKLATVLPAESSTPEELVSPTTTLFVVKTTIPPSRQKDASFTQSSMHSSKESAPDLRTLVETAKSADEMDHIPARTTTAEYDDDMKTTNVVTQLTSTSGKPPSLPIAPPRTRVGQSPRFDDEEKTDSNSTEGKTTSMDTTIMQDGFPVSTASGISALQELATEPESIPSERTTPIKNSTTISETVEPPVLATNSFKYKSKINKGANEKVVGGKGLGSSSTSKKKSGVTIMGHDGAKVTRKKQLLEKSYRDDADPAAATAVGITAAAVAIPAKEALEEGENHKIMEPIMTVGATIMSISTAAPSSPDSISDSAANLNNITGAARIHPTLIRDNVKSMDARMAEMEAENELWSGYDTKKIYFTTSIPVGTIVNDIQLTKNPPTNSINSTAANPVEPETIISLSSTPKGDAESTETDAIPEAIDTGVNVTNGTSFATESYPSTAPTIIADGTTTSTTTRSDKRIASTFVTTVDLNNSSTSASIDDVSITMVTKEVLTAATPSSASLMRTSKPDKLNETDILVVEITSADNNTNDMLSHDDSAYNGNTIPKFTIHNDGISEYDSGNTRPYGTGAEIDYESSKSQADDELFVPNLKLEAIDEGPSVTVSAKEKSNGSQRETIDRDSDTIFYISNTEVKVMESKPTQNSKLGSMEKSLSDLNSNFNSHRPSVDSQYFPSIYEEDVIIDFPAQNITYGVAPNQASSAKDDDSSSKAQIYEEDIILSPLKNNFDPLKIIANRNGNAIEPNVKGFPEAAAGTRHISPLSLENNPSLTYIGEKLIEVEPSQTDSPITFPQQSPNNSETPLEVNESLVPISDVIIQPAIIPEMSIGVPVIGELPPQIELKEIDFLADNPMVGSQSSNNAGNDPNGEKFDGIQYGGDLFAHDTSVLTGSAGYDMDTEYIFGGRHHPYNNANGYNPLNDPIKVNHDKNLENERNMAASYDGNNDVTVASRIFMNAVGNLQKDQLIAEVRSGFKELSTRHGMNANGTGSAENLTNATAYSVMEEADGDFLNFTDMQTLFLACFATLVPLILCVLLAVGLRYLWRKYRPGPSVGGLMGDNSTDPLAGKSLTLSQDELKSTESGYAINRSNDTLESNDTEIDTKSEDRNRLAYRNAVVSETTTHDLMPNGMITSTSNHSAVNGSVITMTLKNNHLIVETEERNDISRDARETKMHYTPSDKDGVFVVEVARGADSSVIPGSPRNNAETRPLSHTVDIEKAEINPKNDAKQAASHEQVQIHQPPREGEASGSNAVDMKDLAEGNNSMFVKPVTEPLNTTLTSSNTGLSQSDLSTSSADSNKGYTYGNQQLYTLDTKGYRPPSPKNNISTKVSPSKCENDEFGPVNGSVSPGISKKSSLETKPIITAALLKQDTVNEINDKCNTQSQKSADNERSLPNGTLVLDVNNTHMGNTSQTYNQDECLTSDKSNEANNVDPPPTRQCQFENGEKALVTENNGHHNEDDSLKEVHENGVENGQMDNGSEDINDAENGFDSIISLPPPPPTSEEIKQLNDVILMDTNQLDSLPPPPPPVDGQTFVLNHSVATNGHSLEGQQNGVAVPVAITGTS